MIVLTHTPVGGQIVVVRLAAVASQSLDAALARALTARRVAEALRRTVRQAVALWAAERHIAEADLNDISIILLPAGTTFPPMIVTHIALVAMVPGVTFAAHALSAQAVAHIAQRPGAQTATRLAAARRLAPEACLAALAAPALRVASAKDMIIRICS